MKKHFRLLSIFLVLILSFSLFSVNAYAVEDTENLVDGNLSNWTDFGDESEYFQSANVSYLANNVNYIEVQSSDTSVYLFDVTEFLKIGESYNFSFTLPTTDGANSTSLDSCELSWFLTDGSGDLYPTVGNDVFQLSINNGNKSNYLGKTTVFEFTYTQGFQNTFLCLAINPGEDLEAYNDLELYISNISLERVTSESEKKLDGILGWLQDIWDKLVSIGDSLTEVWTNITSSVSALGDRISSFFSELGSKISTEFTNLTSDFSGYISSLGDRISNYFTNLSVNINGFFTDLLDGIKEFFRGFGNLILYFNWEGEFENPFVYEHSLIGDFVGSGSDGEDDSGSSINNSLISINNLYEFSFTGTSQQFLFIEDSYARYYQPSSARFFGSQIAIDNVPISLDMNTEYKLSFNINNYVNSKKNDGKYPYIRVEFSDSQYNFQENISENRLYEFTFSTHTPVTINYIIIGTSSIAFMECQLDISDLELVKVTEDGSSDTDEEGTTEKKSVSQFFDDLVEYLSGVSDDIETVIDSITGPVVLLDEFTKRFEWLFGIVTFVLMMIVASRFIGL